MASMVHPSVLTAGQWVGHWQIVSKLGAGSFGAVYKVECSGEPFALKFAMRRAESDDGNLTDARLRRELACLVRVRHPNIVRALAFGCWPHPAEGYHYLLMDYVEGACLGQWAQSKRPTIRRTLALFGKLALALDAAHCAGVRHRDVKPANILVDTREQPMLVDFGSGDHVDAQPITQMPLPPGTPHYRSPEALRFYRLHMGDPRARYVFGKTEDLYALGVTLYEVLTGRPPFSPELPYEILNMQIECRMPPPPTEFEARIPEPVSDLVMRLLAKNPDDRPQSGALLHRELRALQKGGEALELPVLAQSPDTRPTEKS